MKKILCAVFLVGGIAFLGFSFSPVFAEPKEAEDCLDYCTFLGKKEMKEGKEVELSKAQPKDKTCICNPLGQGTKFTDVVDRILNILFFIAIAVAPVMIIVAGFKFLTGGGNPETLQGARQMLIWTAVGFGIILLSKGIVMILRSIIGF
ncbi:MAG: pilin [bacterium]|nr:pilin [bacterium]